MSNDELQQLKALALAATPGPWEVDTVRSDGEYGSDDDGGYGFDSYQVTTDTGACVVDCLNNDVGAVHVENDGRAWDKVAKHDAQYIAAASPDVVLSLVAEIAELRAAVSTPAVASGALPELPEPEYLGGDEAYGDVIKGHTDESMRAYGQACAAAAAPVVPVAAQPVVPEGWQLVPKALTDEMIVAFAEQWYSHKQVFDDPEMADAYKSMLAVAPQPAASVTDVAEDVLKDIQRYSLHEYLSTEYAPYSQIDFDSAGEYVRLDDVIAAIAAQQGEKT